jgi:hypothetical protein
MPRVLLLFTLHALMLATMHINVRWQAVQVHSYSRFLLLFKLRTDAFRI